MPSTNTPTDAGASTGPTDMLFDSLEVGDEIDVKGILNSLKQINPEQIIDHRLAQLWIKARIALKSIDDHIDNERFRLNRDPR
jgi:hypothetical protein